MTEHKIVPIEPTDGMRYKGGEATSKYIDWSPEYEDEQPERVADAVYKAMIAAAPTSYQSENTTLRSQVESLLAVNQAMRDALQKISDMDYGPQSKLDKCAHDKYQFEDCEQCVIEVADAALAMKSGDVELVEVGTVASQSTYLDEVLFSPDRNTSCVEVGTKLYALKQKEG
jgi:predicted transglutaminase-like cysteine proteinase